MPKPVKFLGQYLARAVPFPRLPPPRPRCDGATIPCRRHSCAGLPAGNTGHEPPVNRMDNREEFRFFGLATRFLPFDGYHYTNCCI
jgi:hypothetical protein